MLELYASWAFRHVALQQPDFANYPEVVVLPKKMFQIKIFLGIFFNCKIITCHEITIFKKEITQIQRARATWFSYCCASQVSRYDDFNKF